MGKRFKRDVKYELGTADGRDAIIVSGLGDMNLSDTLECGQAFRYEAVRKKENYVEYLTVVGDMIIDVGQRIPGELIFYGVDEEKFNKVIVPYFALDIDFGEIRKDIVLRTNSQWLKNAAEYARGIHILKQDSWEALFSFIISQNNNIPKIRKIIKKLSIEYGENLALKSGLAACPMGRFTTLPCDEACRECGICYSFPTAESVLQNKEKLNLAKVGFRYKYLVDCAEKIHTGDIDLQRAERAETFEECIDELKKISGVGDKVASCVALFGMARLEAFPIDVWMKRAIDLYFDGHLEPKELGDFAGVAQQYIFHYIRNLENTKSTPKD